jgi:hypothetical protein
LIDERSVSSCPQCRNAADQERFGNCAGGQYSQKAQRQARTRDEKPGRGRTQCSESAATHEYLHGAAAGKPPGAIAGIRAAGAGFNGWRIEDAPQFFARRS